MFVWSALLAARAAPAAELVVSKEPLIVVVNDFATPAETAHLLSIAEGCANASFALCESTKSALAPTRRPTKSLATVRRSTSYKLALEAEDETRDPVLYAILRRMHEAARVPLEMGEAAQVVEYGAGDRYDFHHDSLDRRATALLYLEGADGGEIVFPLLRNLSSLTAEAPLPPAAVARRSPSGRIMVDSLRDMEPYCLSDYYVRLAPAPGRLVLFFSYSVDMTQDLRAIHGACQVRAGRKRALQRWMHFTENALRAAAVNHSGPVQHLPFEELATTTAPPSPAEEAAEAGREVARVQAPAAPAEGASAAAAQAPAPSTSAEPAAEVGEDPHFLKQLEI